MQVRRAASPYANFPALLISSSGCEHLAPQVPFGYCWSEAVLPKPADWGAYIDVCGYFTLFEGRRTSYQPPQKLADFLAAGKQFFICRSVICPRLSVTSPASCGRPSLTGKRVSDVC